MSDDPHQFAKTAYLKKSTGHPLTAEEAHAVDAFLTIPEGRAYVEGTEAMREALCTNLAVVALLGFLAGWGLAAGLAGTVLLLSAFVRWSLRRMRMRQDAELWGWWEEAFE